jgi:hypothetical protein
MTDPRVAQYEQERADAVELAHRAMATSYIGKPPPGLRGDADRMVAALLKAGWTPPGERVTEHAVRMESGAMSIRTGALERIYPKLDDWIQAEQRLGSTVAKRRIIVVEDWTEVPRG